MKSSGRILPIPDPKIAALAIASPLSCKIRHARKRRQVCKLDYNENPVSLATPTRETVPTPSELRRLLDALLPGDSDLNGFVYDHYPGLLARFQPGLDRGAKLDLVLDHADPTDLVRRLRERGISGRRRRASEVFDWTTERQRYAELFGRQPVLDILDEALRHGGWVVVSGRPGVGKTALLIHLLNQLERRRGRAVPHHFLRRTIADSSRPGAVLRALAAQIEAQYPHQTDPDAPPELRLTQLLSRVAQQGLAAGDDLVLIVDGLDEVEPEGFANPLPRCLPPELPPGVTLVCSIDPRCPYFDWLMDHAQAQLGGHIDLDGPIGRSSTVSACQATAMYHGIQLGLDELQIDRLGKAADGSMLCAVKLCQILRERGDTSSEQLLASVPLGLDALLHRLWTKLAPEAQEILALLCTARQALPLPILDELLGLDPGTAARLLQTTRAFIHFEPAPAVTSLSDDCVSFSHSALKEFVENAIGPLAIQKYQRQLGAALCSWPPLEDSLYGFRRLYALRHAVTQHIESDAVAHASQVIGSVDYLVAKCQESGSAALAEDLEHAAARCLIPEAARTFSDLAQALRLGAHWLAQDPSALPGLLYNLLRCAGWSPPIIERVLNFAPQRLRFRLAHSLQRRDTSVHTFAGHFDSVVACSLTPDTKGLVSVGLDHTVRLWDLNSGTQLMHFYGHAGGPTAFAVTRDGQTLLYAAHDNSLALYDLRSGAQLRRLRGHSAPITACALHPDGARVLTAARDHKLKLWDLESGEELLTLSGHSGAITACLITRDGKRAVSAGWDHSVRVWDLTSGRNLHSFFQHTGAVSMIHPLGDDRRLVSASWDHTLQLWDLESFTALRAFKGHSAPVNAGVVTPDGKLLVSASDDRTVKLWDLESGHELRTLTSHTASVKDCAIGPGGRTVLSLSEDWTLRQWDIKTGELQRVLAGHLGPVLACAVLHHSHQVVTASEDKTLKLWDLGTAPEQSHQEGHSDAVNACFLTPDGTHAATASADQTVKLWDLQTGRVLNTLIGHTDAVSACAPCPDGRRLVSTSPDGTVVVWDLGTGTETLRFSTTASGRQLAAGQPAGAHLAIPSDDHMIEFWGMPLDSPRRSEVSALLRVRGCAVAPDGRHLITAAGDRMLRLWDLGTGAELLRFTGHTGSINACTVHPDGRRMVSASSDRLLILWDLGTGAEIQRFAGHTGSVNTCAISPDGKRLLSGSHDQTIRLWDLQSGAELSRFVGHMAPLTAVLFTADGRRAISAALDYTVRLWELTSGMCFETIYGSSPFLCLDARGDWLCAGDQVGNVWLLRDMSNALPNSEARISRQSLMESLRKFLGKPR
jgi:WD40 repeat protein